MIEQAGKCQSTRTASYLATRSLILLCPILLLALALLLTACGPASSPPEGPRVQAALPTPTLEPTFTPAWLPTNTPRPSPTATSAKPTPTPTPQSVLSGRILDQVTNRPVAGAKVSVGSVTVTTDTEGRYSLTGLPPGRYILSITHPDYDPGLSNIFTLAAGQEQSLDLTLYAPDTSPYPKDPMLTNPLDPNGAPTAEDAERLARLQGLTGDVVNIRETKLSGEYLVNYKIGDEVRAAVAELDHEVWELTDGAGRAWWIIKVCGNLASPLLVEVAVPTPRPRPLPPMAEVIVDELIVRGCASETCAQVGTVERGTQIEVVGCTVDGSWCEVGLPASGSGWCTGQSLRQLAMAEAVPVVKVVLPTATPGVATGEGKIAFTCTRDGNWDIYVMNADGSELTRLTDHPEKDRAPAWSPDRQQIAFQSGRNSDNWGIYVMNADGSGQTPLTGQTTNDLGPSWSPDGRQIAFTSERDGNSEIYVMNADGSDLKRLTYHPALDSGPAWSPDGQRIAFYSNRDRNWEVYVMSADGSNQVRLTYNSVYDFSPAWSVDGRQIFFVSDHDGNRDIYMMNADGSGRTPLTDHPAIDWYPARSPDGQKIAFISQRDGDGEVYVMNADGSDETRLTYDCAALDPAWSH
jgi:Tol biopolymer transport system component